MFGDAQKVKLRMEHKAENNGFCQKVLLKPR